MKRTRGIVQPRATGAGGALTGKMTPTSQQVASFWRGTGKLQDMGELSGQPELADTATRRDALPASRTTQDLVGMYSSPTAVTEEDIIEESTVSGGGGGGSYDWLEEEATASNRPAPVGLILLGLAGLAAWAWR